jgi:hypothetical protein
MTDGLTYGRLARLRLAIAEIAADISEFTRDLVPTHTDRQTPSGHWIKQARQLLADAELLMSLAVAYERRRGTSWSEIGELFGVSSEVVQDHFGPYERQLDDDISLSWVRGDDLGYSGLPLAAAVPAARASDLDTWVTDRLQPSDPLAYISPTHPDRTHPVSNGLPPIDRLEQGFLTATARSILSRWRADNEYIDPGLEKNLMHRQIDLYQAMLVDETRQPGSAGIDAHQLQRLLTDLTAQLRWAVPPGVEDGSG